MKPLIPYFQASEVPIYRGLTVSGWGILVVLGFVFGTWLAVRKARRDRLEPALIYELVVWLFIGVFAGGHLGSLLFHYPGTLFAHPMELFRFRYGLSSFGALIACAGLGIWFFRRENRKRQSAALPGLPQISIWAYADAALYGFPLGWFFGRAGCFAVHDHPGIQTEFWLGVYGICRNGSMTDACHDLGLYEALWSLAMLGLFLILDRRPRFPGFFVGLAFVAYGPSRFLMDFLRDPSVDVRYGGLTPAQYGSVALLVLGGWILWAHRSRQPTRALVSRSKSVEEARV